MEFAIPVDHRVKNKELEKIDKYLDLSRELKKAMEHECDGNTNCNWCVWNDTKGLVKWLEELEIGRREETIQVTCWDRPEYWEES